MNKWVDTSGRINESHKNHSSSENEGNCIVSGLNVDKILNGSGDEPVYVCGFGFYDEGSRWEVE